MVCNVFGRFPHPVLATALILLLSACSDKTPQKYDSQIRDVPSVTGETRVLIFSKTEAGKYRHQSIPAGRLALQQLAEQREWGYFSTENGAIFEHEGLQQFNVLILLSPAGDVLNEAQQQGLRAFVEQGGGLVGIHAAAEAEPQWDWYLKALGATYAGHSKVLPATIHFSAPHPVTDGFQSLSLTDEWWAFTMTPDTDIQVLATVDEKSYDPGTATMGESHPVIWAHQMGAGRILYTALGHTDEIYFNPEFLLLLERAILWSSDNL